MSELDAVQNKRERGWEVGACMRHKKEKHKAHKCRVPRHVPEEKESHWDYCNTSISDQKNTDLGSYLKQTKKNFIFLFLYLFYRNQKK